MRTLSYRFELRLGQFSHSINRITYPNFVVAAMTLPLHFCVLASLLLTLVSSINWNDRWQVLAGDGKSESLCHHKLPHPNEYLSKTSYSSKDLIPMTQEERKSDHCSFIGAACFMEADEHELVFKYIHANDTVLEVSVYVLSESSRSQMS